VSFRSQGRLALRLGLAVVAVACACSAPAAQAFTIPTIKPFKLGLYKVTVGLSGQASENASGIDCTTAGGVGVICDETDSASYHVDITYPTVELVISGKPPTQLPSYTNNSKHVVNGSFNESGHWSPDGTTEAAFSCTGSLDGITAEGGGDNLQWKRHGSSYDFSDITEQYGFSGIGHGSDPCNKSAWFGDGRLELNNEMTAFFTVTKSELGMRSFTKIVSGPDSRYREPDTCLQDRHTGTCKFDAGWHAVIKFSRTRLIKA
jgi:hypothetical protein